MVADGELIPLEDPRPLWPQVFALADASDIEDDASSEGGALLSDGTGVWWAATQLGRKAPAVVDEESTMDSRSIDALLVGLQAPPEAHIADEALAEWLKFFAGHKVEQR